MNELDKLVIDINPNEKSGKYNDHSLERQPSINFGGGIELLMNEKKKGSSVDLGLGELSDLENELNDLSEEIGQKSLENSKSNIFNNAINSIETSSSAPLNVQFNDNTEKSVYSNSKDEKPNTIGSATVEKLNDTKTWDGYGKFNNIPNIPSDIGMSKEEL
jgi:hypothetical protein